MNSRRLIFVYIAFLALCVPAMKIGWLIPDGAGYCSYNASLILDGDLNFWNQYSVNGIITPNFIHGSTLTANGYVFTFWAIGAPMLWMCFWLIGHLLTLVSGVFGHPWTPNGFTIYYNFGVRFATAIMGLSALTLNLFLAKKYVEQKAALWGIILIAIGTPYYWYLFHFADQSHVPASFAISLFLVTWDSYRRGTRENWNGFLLGMLGGFASIVKPNHAVIFLFPLAMWIAEIKHLETKTLARQVLAVMAGTLFAVLLQFWIWYILFGNPLGPILEKGVTHYYKFFAGRFWLFDVLFSSYHGLFFFGPLLILSFWGLFRLVKIDRVFAVPALLILIFHILLMANERYFWEGVAFGLRRIVDWTPLFAIGLALAMRDIKGFWKTIPVAAALWTILLMLAYSRHPVGALNEYQPPSLIAGWIANSLGELPVALRSMVSLPAPAQTFLPALLVFAPLGYVIFLGIVRLCRIAQSGKCSRALTAISLCSFIFTYGLVCRAAIRGEASKEKYAQELHWLAQRQNSVAASEEVSFLLNEGKYVALTRGWDQAKASFLEALQLSPNPESTRAEIAAFVRIHRDPEDAKGYLRSL